MAKFYVGQRVKTVRPDNPINYGICGVIEQIGRWGFGDTLPDGRIKARGAFSDCFVSWDRPVYGRHMEGPARFEQLEPLTPPHEACDDAEFIASLDRLAQKIGEIA